MTAHPDQSATDGRDLLYELHEEECAHGATMRQFDRYRETLTEIALGGLLVPAEDFAREFLEAVGDWKGDSSPALDQKDAS